jgi:MerR family Zn(II)-responsive transcriptional regulator of zntA
MTRTQVARGHDGYFRIGELARRAGVNQRTIRFYEERGLLTPTSRFESGMRLYSDEDVERAQLIRSLQETLGSSLAEIKEMISVEETGVEMALADNDASLTERQSRLKQAVELTRSQLSLISEKGSPLRTTARAAPDRGSSIS